MGAYSMVSVQGKCRSCAWDMSDPRHFREHVPPQHWPRSMFKKRERYVVEGKVYNPNQVEILDDGTVRVLVAVTEPSAEATPEGPQGRQEDPLRPPNASKVCECGWVPKVTSLHPENDIRLHKVKSKNHVKAQSYA